MTGTNNQKSAILRHLALRICGVASYEFCPKLTAKARRLFYNPLGVLILAGSTALLCGIFLHTQGFILFGSAVVVVALGIAWPWLTLRGLLSSISFERARAVEGEQVVLNLTVYNRMPWTAYGLALRGGLCDQTETNNVSQPCINIALVPRRRTIRCRWPFVPMRRGVYPLSRPLLSTGFPFGLWENQQPVSVETHLLVWPRTYPVGPVPMVGGDQQTEGNVSRNKVGSNGDVLGVRPYRRGDSPRRIHWGQSARHDRLIVCELQANARPVIQLILDADPSVHVGQGADSSREWAIRVVASLAKGWLVAGVEVGAVWNGHVVPPASGAKQLNSLLDSLAKLPDSAERSLGEMMASPVCRNFTNGEQVIVTTDIRTSETEFPGSLDDRQHWVVLISQGFLCSGMHSLAKPGRMRVRPWLLIESPEQVPSLLRGGWKEARHGS